MGLQAVVLGLKFGSLLQLLARWSESVVATGTVLGADHAVADR